MSNGLEAIPHPPKTVLLGNLLTLNVRTPVQDLMALARAYGPIFWLDMRGRVLVMVSSAALVDELCDEARFDKSVRGPLRRVRRFGGDGLFTARPQEPNWAKAHNILLPAFSERAMQSYHATMLGVAEELVLEWARFKQPSVRRRHDPRAERVHGGARAAARRRAAAQARAPGAGGRGVHEREGWSTGSSRSGRRAALISPSAPTSSTTCWPTSTSGRASASTTSISAIRCGPSSSRDTRRRAGSCPSRSTRCSTTPTCWRGRPRRWPACSAPTPRRGPPMRRSSS